MSEPKILANELLNEQIRYGQELINLWATLIDQIQSSRIFDAWFTPAKQCAEAWTTYCRGIYQVRNQHWTRCAQTLECDRSMQEVMSTGNIAPQIQTLMTGFFGQPSSTSAADSIVDTAEQVRRKTSHARATQV